MHDGAFGIAIVVVHTGCNFLGLISLSLPCDVRMFMQLMRAPQNMIDDGPLVTLVKQRELDARPELTAASQALESTLTMLCSFLSLEDLCSFLRSDAFADLARQSSPWVVFELGLYLDHTKTLQLIPEAGWITLADDAMTGAIDGHVWQGEPDNAMLEVLSRWVSMVA